MKIHNFKILLNVYKKNINLELFFLNLNYMYKLSQYINIKVFLISLAIGTFAVYTMNDSDKRKIMVYPTPDNIDQIQYKDQADTCFHFKQTQIDCPANPDEISKIVAQ